MNTQKIQNRIGKYHVVGVLSYGSTSHVFKIKQLDDQPSSMIPQNTQNPTNSELVVIDMNCDQGRTINANEKIEEGPKKDWILKMYNMELIKENQFLESVKYDIFIQILCLTYLNHPGVVKAREMLLEFQTLPNPADPQQSIRKLIRAGIVMEICQKGCFNSLINYINRTKILKDNKVDIMKFYLTQIANAVRHLNEDCKILHRDLKAENIMVNKQLDVKVIDYGVSKINMAFVQKVFSHPQKETIFHLFGFASNITVKELHSKIRSHEIKRKNLVGSKHYISPELVEKYRSDMEMIDEAYEKTDVWSFGVFMYRIFHDKYPFQGRNLRQILDTIMNEQTEAQINKQLPDQVREVISKCLKKDYSQRVSWKQLMKMKYFSTMPVDDIFSEISPIASLMMINKQEKEKILHNVERVFFDDRLVLKYENEGNKKRRVMLLKQKDANAVKLLVLKEKDSLCSEWLITNHNGFKIQREEGFAKILYQDQRIDDSLIICTELSKQSGDKLIDAIFQAFQFCKDSKQQETKEMSTGDAE